MKIKLPHGVAAFAVLLGSFSCQENLEVSKEKVPIELQSYENQVAFAERNLKKVAQAVLTMAKDVEFRETVYAQVDGRDDDNALVESLMSATVSNGETLGARMRKQPAGEEMDQAIADFKNIEGQDLHPQVYIPFYENVQARRKDNSSARAADPIVVIYTGDEEQEVYTGYQLNESGELAESDAEIDAEYASNHEVWVIGINEDSGFNEATAAGPSGNAKFTKIRINSHKESWVAGASEVHIKRYMSLYSFTLYTTTPKALGYSAEDAVDDSDGKRIRKVHRRDVDKWLTVGWTYVSNWPSRKIDLGSSGGIQHTDYVYYVVFEYDAWPTKRRDCYIPDAANGNTSLYTSFRSADGPYKVGHVQEYQSNGLISTSGFLFHSVYQ